MIQIKTTTTEMNDNTTIVVIATISLISVLYLSLIRPKPPLSAPSDEKEDCSVNDAPFSTNTGTVPDTPTNPIPDPYVGTTDPWCYFLDLLREGLGVEWPEMLHVFLIYRRLQLSIIGVTFRHLILESFPNIDNMPMLNLLFAHMDSVINELASSLLNRITGLIC